MIDVNNLFTKETYQTNVRGFIATKSDKTHNKVVAEKELDELWAFLFFWAWSGQPAIGQVGKKDSWVWDKRVMGQNRKCMHFLEDWSAEIK